MTEATLNLPDILPDLSGIADDQGPEPFADGWYQGEIIAKREFTDKNGNDRVFESSDDVSQKGDSRNVRLQVVLTRQADKRTLNTSVQVNYRPEDLTQEVVQAVAAEKGKSREEQNSSLFRAKMVLTRLGTLQKIAGVRQLQRNGNGGLDIAPLFGRKAYFRLGPDTNEKYKEVKDFRHDAPKRAQVL